ncbi:hypothetical protein P171DRAFT_488458 [Karstenula rhodostoma CBS 690.94]|uniref:Uncharacterized protein n=1 Tax=Karstenula rhodostoma CBS 690.94 TaxID=1392251 RepID=A0A9P4U9B2_9PLEO|nr:hypothetical protein P171DRAFT_488458 [Karstenula rhodostoma CBS 690.94]
MGIRRKLKSAFRRIKLRGHHDRNPFSTPQSPIRDVAAFYQHPNGQIPPDPIRPVKSYIRTRSTDIQEPLNFTYKSYTTPSGVVIPPDFSYDRPKEVYRVSGILPHNGWGTDMEFDGDEDTEMHGEMDVDSEVFDGDNEASDSGASQASTAPGFSFNTLARMTELALTAHQISHGRRFAHTVSPRPLPEVPEYAGRVHSPSPPRIRILTGRAVRRVRGLRIKSGDSKPSRILRIISGGEASSGDERPRPAWR